MFSDINSRRTLRERLRREGRREELPCEIAASKNVAWRRPGAGLDVDDIKRKGVVRDLRQGGGEDGDSCSSAGRVC
ncbi:hypothetical protein chiPu_0000961 [Chiloscyllium punctatum]|uniref:Uncharacterized protein n=1 Tax=Chiloscyllium punctatum TaxID=137246 RepID=A0A401RWR1_CHIPU|nr:hypothetical protein [Chiloscyllium punctatum]